MAGDPRDAEIIRLTLEGLVQKEIADRIGISLRGVKWRVSRMYRAAGLLQGDRIKFIDLCRSGEMLRTLQKLGTESRSSIDG